MDLKETLGELIERGRPLSVKEEGSVIVTAGPIGKAWVVLDYRDNPVTVHQKDTAIEAADILYELVPKGMLREHARRWWFEANLSNTSLGWNPIPLGEWRPPASWGSRQ